MKRTAALICAALLLGSCTDAGRVQMPRGPFGPADYEVHVRAEGVANGILEERAAELRVTPRPRGAHFALRTEAGEVLTAELRVLADGSVEFVRVRGTPVQGSGETELASLANQLNPPLPDRAVRIGERWSSTQRISTQDLAATFSTELRVVRFRRVAAQDSAELVGEISGRLRVTDGPRVLQGLLNGTTRILWAVEAGRVVEADTSLDWQLGDGNDIALQTLVRTR